MAAGGRLRDPQPLDLGRVDRGRLFGGQCVERRLDIEPCRHLIFELAIAEQIAEIAQGDIVAAPAKVIDHFVPRDLKRPRTECAVAIVTGPSGINGDQRLLHQILQIGCTRYAPRTIAPQHQNERRQQRMACHRVAIEACSHEVPKVTLVCCR